MAAARRRERGRRRLPLRQSNAEFARRRRSWPPHHPRHHLRQVRRSELRPDALGPDERKAVLRVVAADMPPALQRRAFRCARDELAGMPHYPRRVEPKRLALALKKAMDWRTAEKLLEEMEHSGLCLKGITRSLIAAVKELEMEEESKPSQEA